MKFLLFLITISAIFNQIYGLNNDVQKTCEACNKFTNFVWNLTHNANEELYTSLSKLCSDYSDTPGSQSQKFCNKSLHTLFEFLNQRLNREKFCIDIHACPGGNDNGIRPLNSFSNDQTDCQFCIYINTKIKELITGSPTELEIKAHFEDACHYMKSFENECLNLVDQYVDTIFDYIKQKFIPQDICKSLRICPVKTGPLNNMPTTNKLLSSAEIINVMPVNTSMAGVADRTQQNPTCDICKKIVKIIQRQLKDNATDEQIINVLSEICEVFPSKERDHCKQIVRNYANQLIQILSQDIDSDTACLLAGLCSDQSFNDYLNGRYQLKGNALCVECEMIAHFIQNEMNNYKNERQIEEWIKNHLCNRMSYVISPANCNAFIQQYGPIIMQTIAQDVFNPDMLCYKELKLCKKTKIHVIPKNPKSTENIKCEICHDVVKDLSNVNQNSQNEIMIDDIIEKGCKKMPQSHQDECSLFVKSFALHLMDMLERYDPKKICESIDICWAPGQVHMLGGHKCTFGPSYWCHSVSHANACQAYNYCYEKMWNPKK